jgi:hypothetical protein
MSLSEFVALHAFILLNAFVLILFPVAYFKIIPEFLQLQVDRIGTSGNPVRVKKMAITGFSESAITFESNIFIHPFGPIPLYGGFGPIVAHLTVDGKELAQAELPEASYWLNREINMVANGTIKFTSDQKQNLNDIIGQFSTPEGLKNLTVKIKLAPSVTAFGFTAYSSLPLHRDLVLGDVAGTTSSLLKSGDETSSNDGPKLIFIESDVVRGC